MKDEEIIILTQSDFDNLDHHEMPTAVGASDFSDIIDFEKMCDDLVEQE